MVLRADCRPYTAQYPYLIGNKVIPSLPFLILCPGTLSVQWIHEIKVLSLPHSSDIFVYDGRLPFEDFWATFQKSKHDMHFRIIVANHSVSPVHRLDLVLTRCTLDHRRRNETPARRRP